MPPTAADVSGLLRVLSEHGVQFVVVGGVCAVIHGAALSTFDLDIVPDRSEPNIGRLLGALEELDAVHRDLAGRTIRPDASRLSGAGHNLLMTRAGPLDVLGAIGHGRDYPALASRSRLIDIGNGVSVLVLDLESLVEIKRETGRAKDLATLPILIRTLEERRRRDG